MKPLPGADEPGETVDQRVAEQIEAARRRRLADKTLRTLMARRRAHGLAARYALKEQQMTPTATGPRYTDEQIFTVRHSNPLADVVRDIRHEAHTVIQQAAGRDAPAFVELIDRGDGVLVNPVTRDFYVNPHTGTWYCDHCGESGDVIAYVRKMKGIGFAEAVEYLARRAGINL